MTTEDTKDAEDTKDTGVSGTSLLLFLRLYPLAGALQMMYVVSFGALCDLMCGQVYGLSVVSFSCLEYDRDMPVATALCVDKQAVRIVEIEATCLNGARRQNHAISVRLHQAT